MEKTIESSLPVGIWLKVVSFIKFGVATTAESSVVLKQSVVMGNTCTGHESSVPEDASVKSALLDKYFLSWTD